MLVASVIAVSSVVVLYVLLSTVPYQIFQRRFRSATRNTDGKADVEMLDTFYFFPYPVGGLLRFVSEIKKLGFVSVINKTLDRINPSHAVLGSMSLGFSPFLMLIRPDVIEDVFTKDETKYGRQSLKILPTFNTLFPGSIIFAEGKEWAKQHRLLYRALTPGSVKTFVPIMDRHTHLMLDSFLQSETVNLRVSLQKMALAIVTESAFGYDSTAEEFDEFTHHFQVAMSSMQNPLMLIPGFRYLPFKSGRDLNIALRKADEFTLKVMNISRERRERQATGEDDSNFTGRKSLVDLMLESNESDDEHYRLTDEEVFRNAVLFLSAGSETTATTLNWCVLFLIQYPEYLQKLKKEILSKIGPKGNVTADQFGQLPLLEAFIKEVMRMRPAAAGVPSRKTREDMEIGGHFVPKGSHIGIQTFALHFRPSVWGEDAGMFRPERFISEQSVTSSAESNVVSRNVSLQQGLDKKYKYAWVPFGAGRRTCIGKHFAEYEMKTTLIGLLRRVDRISHPSINPDDAPAMVNDNPAFDIAFAAPLMPPRIGTGFVFQANQQY